LILASCGSSPSSSGSPQGDALSNSPLNGSQPLAGRSDSGGGADDKLVYTEVAELVAKEVEMPEELYPALRSLVTAINAIGDAVCVPGALTLEERRALTYYCISSWKRIELGKLDVGWSLTDSAAIDSTAQAIRDANRMERYRTLENAGSYFTYFRFVPLADRPSLAAFADRLVMLNQKSIYFIQPVPAGITLAHDLYPEEKVALSRVVGDSCWAAMKLSCPVAWERYGTFVGSRIGVAVVDTGILLGQDEANPLMHEELVGQVTNLPEIGPDNLPIIDNPAHSGSESMYWPNDEDWHGTAIAGFRTATSEKSVTLVQYQQSSQFVKITALGLSQSTLAPRWSILLRSISEPPTICPRRLL
jgi:hypothetical protein